MLMQASTNRLVACDDFTFGAQELSSCEVGRRLKVMPSSPCLVPCGLRTLVTVLRGVGVSPPFPSHVLIPTLNSRILAPFDGCISPSTYTRHARKNPRDRLENLSWDITELNSEQLDRTIQMKNDAICDSILGRHSPRFA
jgi:hypothetical protein